uniref:Uncharacterized protein n=1 Tax=Brassica oleracea var. oleracea TaxID=109376 RepID=A0A0D3AQ14_BRAOL
MANIFLIASGSRRTRRNPKEKRSNTNSIPDNNFSCKKHTKHRQSPGIRSLCLIDRLSKVSLEYYSYTKNAAETASSYYSSTSSSTSVSSYYLLDSGLIMDFQLKSNWIKTH